MILNILAGLKDFFSHTAFNCSILGTPFYVMEYAQGRLFKDPSLPGMTVEERKVCNFLKAF